MANPSSDETPEQLLARIEAEHGPEVAEVTRRFMATPPRTGRRFTDVRLVVEGKRARPGLGTGGGSTGSATFHRRNSAERTW